MSQAAEAGGGASDCGGGVFALSGDYLHLLHGLDHVVLGWARELGAVPRRYPALIPTELLLRTDYYGSFPGQATFAAPARPELHEDLKAAVGEGRLDGGLAVPAMQLRPALCYHVYAELAGLVIEEEVRVFTIFGCCYRHEERPVPLQRQREFSMREIVEVGDPKTIEEHRQRLREQSEALSRELGLGATADVATDPFFGTANRGRLLYQRERQLKWEITQELSNGDALAIASLNLHEEYFTSAFSIHRDAERTTLAATGCNGWGYERWIAAVVDRHGADPGGWPASVRKLVERGAAAGPPA